MQSGTNSFNREMVRQGQAATTGVHLSQWPLTDAAGLEQLENLVSFMCPPSRGVSSKQERELA